MSDWTPFQKTLEEVVLHYFVFQGKLLHINVSAGIIVSNQSLVLQGVSRSTAGNYTCVGYNAEGEGESEPFYLNILCKYQLGRFSHFSL